MPESPPRSLFEDSNSSPIQLATSLEVGFRKIQKFQVASVKRGLENYETMDEFKARSYRHSGPVVQKLSSRRAKRGPSTGTSAQTMLKRGVAYGRQLFPPVVPRKVNIDINAPIVHCYV